MIPSGKPFAAHCCDLIKLPFKFVIAILVIASSSEVRSQSIETIYSFNGENPNGLTLGNDGNFYGTTLEGGTLGVGSVFQISTNGTFATLASFDNSTGADPRGALTVGTDGNLYGTTAKGGPLYYLNGYDDGTVFQVTTNGTLTSLVSFYGFDGEFPVAGLTLGNDGNFYGTTPDGGSDSEGTVFQVTTNGTLTTLVSFNGSNGAYPEAALTLGNDGNLYGTTPDGGSDGEGTIFQVTTNGALTTLFSFNGPNGAYPDAGLTLGNDGNFYGTTPDGGTANEGTIFQVTTNGALTTLVSFNGTNGGNPRAALTLGNDGNFYGTTVVGGSDDEGTIFQVTTNGTLTTLASFDVTDGAGPMAALTLGNDGNFYATTSMGGSGSGGGGTVFRFLFTPPIITVQPQSQTNNAGATVTFTCETLLPALGFQWKKNGTNLINGGNILGATNATLTITDISDTDAASYSVIMSNEEGCVLSSNATLTVIDPPSITAQPTNQMVMPGTNVAFGVTLAGSPPFAYQWQFNRTNLLNATNAIYTILSVITNEAGYYSLVVSNQAGSAVSSNAALTVVLSPMSRTNYAGSTSTFIATAFSPETLNYQWQKDGANLVDGGNVSGSTNSTLTIANISDTDGAFYNLVVSDAIGSVTTSNAVLTVNDLPYIATQPQSQTVLVGSSVTFSASAYGAPPLVFQWYFNGTPIGSPVGATNFSSLTLTDVGTNQAGNYAVEVVNGYDSAISSNATLIVSLPPIITAQPSSRTNIANTTATFSVAVSSVSPVSFQWQKNGTNLANGGQVSGVTNNTLTITSVSDNNAAAYSVAITNLAGSVTSSNGLLTVIDPPGITAQPLSQRVLLGASVSFNVTTSNTLPLNYQWRLNAASILNATNATYAIQAVSATNSGNYSVVVTNLAGTVTSSNALLTVLVPPSLTLQLWAGYPLLNLNGMLSNNFVVQYNSNFTGTNWTTLLSLTNLPSSPYIFLDPAGVLPPARFYRAVME
jgi:uncharacterized repeat protein (TIGR03803 family)